MGQGRAERAHQGRLTPSPGIDLCFPRAASRRVSPTFPIGCIRGVGFKSPMTDPDDGFLPPGRCRPVRAIQIPDGDSRESRNAGLRVGRGRVGGGAQAGGQEGESPWRELRLTTPPLTFTRSGGGRRLVPSSVREPVVQRGQSEKHQDISAASQSRPETPDPGSTHLGIAVRQGRHFAPSNFPHGSPSPQCDCVWRQGLCGGD